MRAIYFLSLLLFVFFSCSENRKTNFKVDVTVNESDGGFVYLARLTLNGTVTVDSVLPRKSGTYLLKGFTDMPDFFIVYKDPREYINLVIHPGDDFKVLTSESSFDENYIIEGSKDSRMIQKMVSAQIRTLEKITEISTELENSQGSPDYLKTKARIDSTYEKLINEHRQFSVKLIEENQKSLVSLMALYQQLGRNIRVFDYKKDFRYYALVDSNLTALYPRSEAVIDLNLKVTELRDLLTIEIGSLAADISLPDQKGDMVSLSSLRQKYVLLVFWASWSDQSLSEVQKFSALYPRFSRNELEYYQVSLDRTRDSWLSGLDQVNACGIHVSDLKYWDSPVVGMYRIEQLPAVFLMDEKRLIINKDFTAEDLPGIIAKLLVE